MLNIGCYVMSFCFLFVVLGPIPTFALAFIGMAIWLLGLFFQQTTNSINRQRADAEQQKAQKRVDRVKKKMGEVEGVEYDAQYYEKQRRLMDSDEGKEPDQIAPAPPRRPSSFRPPKPRKKP